MTVLAGLILVAGAALWSVGQIVAEMKAAREEAARARTLAVLQLLVPALGAAERDPRALLIWQPLARTVRAIFPSDCAALDRAAGGTFPFTKEQLQAAHSAWTADWLAWERTHDAEYKVKAAALEPDASPLGRARLDAVEREKLDLYQRRYQEYVQVAKALQALSG